MYADAGKPKPDHCYTSPTQTMNIFMATTNIMTDPGIKESESTESNMT